MSANDNFSELYQNIHTEIIDKKQSIDQPRKQSKGFLLIIPICLVFISIAAILIEGKLGKSTTISTPAAAKDLCGENYQSVVEQLQDAGFTNIETQELDQRFLDVFKFNAGKVEKISIAGVTDFEKGAQFSQDDKIKIKYHPLKEK